ncbi:MAG: universal stress protein [Desulfobacteraceae bacterium]|nr:universal stress protein [Desulfobacteraceae bacterium]
MVAPISSILFATNLSEECRPALETAVALATQHKADLVLFYVIAADTPDYIENELESLFGKEKWEEIKKEQEKDVEQTLTGKMSSGGLGKKALQQYCTDAGIDMDSCDFNWRHVIIADKVRSKAILSQANEQGCNLIVLGAGKAFLGGNAVGSTIKTVLRKSKIPVLVVPYAVEV